MRLGSVSIGERVKLCRKGEWESWVVIQHGPPSSAYGGMDGGTVLMKRDWFKTDLLYSESSSKRPFDESVAHGYLNGEFLDSLDPEVAQAVMEVELPCRRGMDISGYYVGSMKARVWLPSIYEITGVMKTTSPVGEVTISTPYIKEGERLRYWQNASYEDYVSWKADGEALPGGGYLDIGWSTRTPNRGGSMYNYIDYAGRACEGYNNRMAVYPCLVLPDRAEVDGENGRLSIPEGNARLRIDGAWVRQRGLWCRREGVWHKADRLYANIGGVWKR